MSKEVIFSARKKDFDIEYFTGRGPGGQKRNKKALCCRMTHRETGVTAVSTRHKSREQNKKEAFLTLVDRLMAHLDLKTTDNRPISQTNQQIVRTYHAIRGTAKDHRTKIVCPYNATLDGELDPFVDAMKEQDYA